MKRALLSVYDKTDIVSFAQGLIDLGFELVATGGTQTALTEAGLAVTPVETITGFPEMLGGRVKTLHPAVHAGILARREDPADMAAIAAQDIAPVDVVAINLYPFAATIAQPGVTRGEAIEQIDIGGPTALRAAAKNAAAVWAVCDPADYAAALAGIAEDDGDLRQRLAAKVFQTTAAYDAQIAAYLDPEPFPVQFTPTYTRRELMRYGENSHQQAAFYVAPDAPAASLANATQLHGKAMSYNNLKDADAALAMVQEFDRPAVVAVKHMNPCGIGLGDTIEAAWDKAYAADSMSIFGGIIALNRPVDLATATKMHALFLEIIMAPSFDDDAYAILAKKKNLRLLTLSLGTHPQGQLESVSVVGGLLRQTRDEQIETSADLTVVTKLAPTPEQEAALLFAQQVVKHVKSNAIVVAKADQTLGIGAGQMNRIGSVEIAIRQAQTNPAFAGAVMASDAFFPMDDCVRYAAQHGIRAIIQPGGSIRDADSIAVADEYGIAMVTTGVRHFRH
ncbi:bifunctional phosphoribosylaminoimidazolecarboxamide formyltransferase/IMP cyclohydrolase [Lacticaseibacillus nasuensis]|uniref:bifunctional phosphoribosylaminoimidazolecarboxamide formyltransferase/IMP cyclohydrolase n=1 Tax=Lacticaseibacillus nasuensis TaxID=944671 RepID=UPI002245EF40|nr:bifunctional phosphoribosylaminoimidazolecarboxamide formyltransferase/IMP cyclohydrolase [Lacticaseibacillus nasuensis]MCX2454753.1 bifunctional phosphoribosylaminoimidazolecarboxamide formyltransferase/IMP cyclohydrolase [Lacticaseibacillus nasuensis]